MPITNQIVNMFSPEGFSGLITTLTIILEFAYVIFSFIQLRQVKLMNSSFKTTAAGFFRTLAGINFIASIILVVISLIVL